MAQQLLHLNCNRLQSIHTCLCSFVRLCRVLWTYGELCQVVKPPESTRSHSEMARSFEMWRERKKGTVNVKVEDGNMIWFYYVGILQHD